MSERKIFITNFRNIGINNEHQELLLNTNIEKNGLGGLVILIGPNNSGKTNILDALFAFGVDGKLISSDRTDFLNNNPIPRIDFVTVDQKTTISYFKTLEDNNIENISHYIKKGNNNIIKSANISIEAFKFFTKIIDLAKQYNFFNTLSHQKQLQLKNKNIDKRLFNSDDFDILTEIFNICSVKLGKDWLRRFLSINDENAEKYFAELEAATDHKDIEEWKKRNKLGIRPNIFRYTHSELKNDALKIKPDQLGNSLFFQNLFRAIGYEINELKNCYNRSREQNFPGTIKSENKIINKKLIKINKKFNEAFFLKNSNYKFKIYLESNDIYLTIHLNDQALHLDRQSSGFKWFFNFFFWMNAQNLATRGDVIVLDEPATNLHMQGVQELRNIIKDFAKKHELTFVISTHIPFFIDVNYLEEIRVIQRRKDGGVTIENMFHAIGDRETDALKAIKKSLTVGRYVLYDQTNLRTIFVEGITDYCYLTAFKHFFKIDGLVFLPIQGLAKPLVLETLLEIEKQPIILVDSDKNGFDLIKKNNENSKKANIFHLKQIDSDWTNIESLFQKREIPETKGFKTASNFKNSLVKGKVSNKTFDNFRKLLNFLSEIE